MMDKLGVQTFTVRNEIKTPDEIRKTFTRLSEIGYKRFELARMKYDQAELNVLKELKDEFNFEYVTCQIKMKTIIENFDWLMKYSIELGIPTIEVSVIPIPAFIKREKGMIELSGQLNVLGRRTKERGIHLLYHHHNFELIKMGGKLGIDHLMDNTDPDLVNFVFDTYWLARSGFDPYSFVKKNEKRVKGIHLRDSEMISKGFAFSYRDQVVGKGSIAFNQFKSDSLKNVDFYSVEQDSKNPISDLESSFDYLNNL